MKTNNFDKPIIIYGANIIARQLYYSICRNNAKERLVGFAVTDKKGNPDFIDDVPVREFKEYLPQAKECSIILAMGIRLQPVVTAYIEEQGCKVDRAYDFKAINDLEFQEIIEDFNTGNEQLVITDDIYDDTYQNVVPKSENCTELQDILYHKHLKYMMLTAQTAEELLDRFRDFDLEKEYFHTLGEYRNIHSSESDTGPSRESGAPDFRIYMCTSHRDKASDLRVEPEEWVYPLQAGAALTEKHIADLRDDVGDGISERNPVFGEMTASYWIWKHVKDCDYKGLCHYRRHYIINRDEINSLTDRHIDVILTTPRITPNGIKNMFLADNPVMDEKAFGDMLTAVEMAHPDEAKSVAEYLEQKLYYPNNMVIAKTEIFDEYSKWIFDVLLTMEELDKKNGNDKQDRHIAYAAELLTSYYFAHNKDRYRIGVTDYRFYD